MLEPEPEPGPETRPHRRLVQEMAMWQRQELEERLGQTLWSIPFGALDLALAVRRVEAERAVDV